MPEAVACPTKRELALAVIDRARAWGVPLRYVAVDAGYGDQPPLLAALDQRAVPYSAAVTSTFGVRLPEAVAAAAQTRPPDQGRGQPPQPRPAPLSTAAALLATLPDETGQVVPWRERPGTPLRRQCAALRVHWGTGAPRLSTTHHRVQTGPEGWLLGTRPLPGAAGEAQDDFLLLPADTPLHRRVERAHRRWPIEQFYEDSKGACGLDDYQGRRWDGLQRHLALVLLAYSYLVWQRLARTPASPAEDGLFPLHPTAVAARSASGCPPLAVRGPCPLAGEDRPDQELPPASQLTA